MNLEYVTSIAFVGLAALLILLERWPRLRRTGAPIAHRWLTNLGLMLIGSMVVSAIYPANITQVARALDGGLLQELPLVLEAALVFLLLDFWRYWEHRLFHEVPLLWRAHLVHHSDTAMDVTTAERHHPLESIITTFLALMLVFALGFSAQALGIYLLVAILSALYTHANIDLPDAIDRSLRRWLVTPAVHAVHHSDYQPETDSNYGSVITLWDRLFGTYTDPDDARVPRFGLECFRDPQDTTLGPVLLQPFEYRQSEQHGLRPLDTRTAADGDSITLSPLWRQALWYGGTGLLLALAALWPTVLDLTGVWNRQEAYQYAWLVLPMFIYLVCWYHRDSILAMTPRPGYAGLPLILAAAALWVVSFTVDIRLGQHVALVLVLQGIALASLGWRTYRSLLPIMLLLFLMIPCGDILQPLLRGLTVKWIEWFAVLTGLPHSIEGFIVYIGEHRYVVVDACSGLTLFTLAGFLGYSFGLLLFRSFGKVLAMAALGAALGILTNALRVCLIVGIDWLRGSQMDLAAHGDIQWLVLLASLAALLFLASRLNHDSWSGQAEQRPLAMTANWPAARFAPVVAGAVLLGTIGLVRGAAHLPGEREAIGVSPLQRLAEQYPDSEWLGAAEENGDALAFAYSPALQAVLLAPVSATGRLDERLLRPANENIWRHANTERYRDCPTDNCVDFIHTTWKQKGTQRTRHTFYAYFVGDTTTDSRLSFRLASGWNRFGGYPHAAGLIAFRLHGDVSPELALGKSFNQIKDYLLGSGDVPVRSNIDSYPAIGLASKQLDLP